MKELFNVEELKEYIKANKFKNEDRIYCKEYPNLIFIFEDNEFIAYYSEGHDLYGDGTLMDLLDQKENYLFSTNQFVNYPDEMN